MRTQLQIAQRCATLAGQIRAAEARIARASVPPTSHDKRRHTMARKQLRAFAAELAEIAAEQREHAR